LKIITHFQATFAVRSGGHSANKGYGSVGNEGVVLDLSALNEISVFEEEGVVSIGPGATWEAVYTQLEKHKLTVAGGRVSDVGVGGLVLGGTFPGMAVSKWKIPI
jgi:FAD/FMN-containing dehydrogenase